jgi:hypothetical protein
MAFYRSPCSPLDMFFYHAHYWNYRSIAHISRDGYARTSLYGMDATSMTDESTPLFAFFMGFRIYCVCYYCLFRFL